MANNDLQTTKVQARVPVRKKDWPTISTRIQSSELVRLDALAYRRSMKRAHLIHEAVRQLLETEAA